MHLAQHLRSAIVVAALSVLVVGCSSVKLDDEQKPAPIVDARKGSAEGADARAVVPIPTIHCLRRVSTSISTASM